MSNFKAIEREYLNNLVYKSKPIKTDRTPPEVTDENVYKLMHKIETVIALYEIFVPRDNEFSRGINECIKFLSNTHQKRTLKSMCLQYLLKKDLQEKPYIQSIQNTYSIFLEIMKNIFNDHTYFNDYSKRKYQIVTYPPGTVTHGIPFCITQKENSKIQKTKENDERTIHSTG